MGEKKERIEPEVSMDPEAPAEDTAHSELTIDDLVPGIEDALAEETGPVTEPDPRDARIAELEAEVADLRDKWTRALAEGENIRRRAERDRQDATTYGGTKLARDLLSVHDNLDRALQAATEEMRETAASLIEGVELTQREMLSAFAKHKIEKVVPEKGEKFDPNRHQAMFEAPVPGATPNTVIEVMQAGFTIADRLLRPAMVGVAKAAPEAQPQEKASGDS